MWRRMHARLVAVICGVHNLSVLLMWRDERLLRSFGARAGGRHGGTGQVLRKVPALPVREHQAERSGISGGWYGGE